MSDADIGRACAAWVTDNWDADLSVGEWWQELADAGYSHPTLPEGAGGRGYNRAGNVAVRTALADAGAMGPPTGLGMMLAAPTIVAHGTPEQIDRLVSPIVNGVDAWCQLFSEPNAGSDRSWVWSCYDFADGELEEKVFALRFANSDIANEFKAKYEEHQKEMEKLLAGEDKPDEGGEAADAAEALAGLKTGDE